MKPKEIIKDFVPEIKEKLQKLWNEGKIVNKDYRDHKHFLMSGFDKQLTGEYNYWCSIISNENIDMYLIKQDPLSQVYKVENGEYAGEVISKRYQPLFDLMYQEHNKILTVSEMDEIIAQASKISEKEYSKDEMFLFAEWAATSYFKLNNFWFHKLKDKCDEKNWITTEKLFNIYNTNG